MAPHGQEDPEGFEERPDKLAVDRPPRMGIGAANGTFG